MTGGDARSIEDLQAKKVWGKGVGRGGDMSKKQWMAASEVEDESEV